MPDQTAPLVFVDTETDGVHHDRRPWEIAVIRRDPDGSTDEVTWMLPLHDLRGADMFGLRIGRFYERHPRGRQLAGVMTGDARQQPPSEVAHAIAELTHGAHWVGAVPSFDTEIIGRLLRQFGILPAWHYHLVDVENLAVGYLAGQGTPLAPPWSSDDLAERLGLDPVPDDERHTALGDARFAMRVYDRVMGGGA